MRDVLDGTFLWGTEMVNFFNRLMNGTYIKTGCAPSHGGGMDVDVAAGTIVHAGAEVAFAGGTATLDVEAVLTIRFDTISISNAGALTVTKGTSEAVAPTLPANHTLVCVVIVNNGAVAIVPGEIFDGRVLKPEHGAVDHDADYLTDAAGPLVVGPTRVVGFTSLLELTTFIGAGASEDREFTNTNRILVVVRTYSDADGSDAADLPVVVKYLTSADAGKQKIRVTNEGGSQVKVDISYIQWAS